MRHSIPRNSCLGFETEFQSISGRLIDDMEASLCVISFGCYFWSIYGVFEQ